MPSPPLAYVFKPDEKISHGFVRMLRAISVQGRRLARRSRDSVAEPVHDVRVLIKRLRALLWFARPALKASVEARAKAQLRKAAGLLAQERDLSVMQSTLKKLTEKASKPRDRAALAQTLQSLDWNPKGAKAKEKALRRALKKTVGILCRTVEEVKRSAADDAEWPRPSERVAKASRTMRKAAQKARLAQTDTNFHEWRKRAKRLLYQLELAEPEPRRRMKQVIKCIAKLQDKLGEDHDCVVVEERLRQTLPLSRAARRVADLLEKRKKRLRARADKIVRRLQALI